MLETLKSDLTQCSPAKQRKLIRFVSSTCQNGDALFDQQHLEELAGLVEPLIDLVENNDEIIDAAQVFAHLDFSPRNLILKFAHKEISIAAPVLEHSVVLQDSDLIEIIKNSDSSYSQFIARRVELTSNVTDTLISNADLTSLTTTICNPGASFSTDGFKELASIGSVDEDFGQALCEREDVPPSLVEPLFINLGIEPKTAHVAKGKKRSVGFADDTSQTKSLQREHSLYLPKAQACIERMTNREMTLDDCVLELEKTNSFKEICQVFAFAKQQKESKITAIFNKITGLQFIQLCNGLQLSEEAFAAITAMRVKHTRLQASQMPMLIQHYKGMADMRT